MGMMGSSMAGSMAGSMIGNAMMGGRGGGEAPAAAAPMAPGGMPSAPCQLETQSFLQCMSATGDNMEYCKQMFDTFKLCQLQASMPQQQQYQ
jgi:hypothetical protein